MSAIPLNPLQTTEKVLEPVEAETYGQKSKRYFAEHHKSGSPRVVFVQFKVNDIKKIEEADGLVHLDFNLYLRWFDPALIGAVKPGFTRTVAEYETLWSPKIEINNGVDLTEMWDGDVSWNLKDTETGEMKYSQRYKGTIGNKMNLHYFPFDIHQLNVVTGPKFMDSTRISLKLEPGVNSTKTAISHSLEEWKVHAVRGVEKLGSKSVATENHFSNCELSIVTVRKSGFYLWKVLLIQLLVAAWSWTVFYMPPDNMSDRMSTLLTLFLAGVAFLFVVNDKLPRIPYLTIMDQVIIFSFIMLFFAAGETFVVFLISQNFGDPDSAHLVDFAARIAFPVVYFSTLAALIARGLSNVRSFQRGAKVKK